MAIQMTRAEYEAKYGQKPDISSSPVASQPIKMTRAEYAAKYGALPTETTPTIKEGTSFTGTLTKPLMEGISGLQTLYGDSEQGIANKLKQDVMSGASDISKGFNEGGISGGVDVAKGVLKSGLRTAGDVAGAIYAPVGAVIGATGIGKVFDYIGKGIADKLDLGSVKAIQDFAIKHPNAEEDFGRALNLAFASMEKGKIEPKTVVPRTMAQVETGVNAVRAIPSKIIQKAESLRNYAQESLVNRTAENLKLTPKQIQIEERFAKDTPKFIVDEGVDHLIKSDGKVLDTSEAVLALKNKANVENRAFASILESDPRYLSLDQWGKNALTNARKTFQGADLDTAVAKINKDVLSYKEQYKNPNLISSTGEQLIPSSKMNEIKQYKWERTKGFGSPEAKLDADLNYQLGSAAKESIEQAYAGDTNITNLNKRLGDFSSAIKILENRNGVKLNSGMLGRMTGRVIGAVASKGAGPLGSLLGAMTGGKLVEILQDPQVSTFTARTILNKLGRTKNGMSIIEEAERLAGQRTARILATKNLPSPEPLGTSKNPIITPSPTTYEAQAKNIGYRNDSQINPTTSAINTASNIKSNSYTPLEIVNNHLSEIDEMLKDPDFAPVIKANPKEAISDIRTDIVRGMRKDGHFSEAMKVENINLPKIKTLSEFRKALKDIIK